MNNTVLRVMHGTLTGFGETLRDRARREDVIDGAWMQASEYLKTRAPDPDVAAYGLTIAQAVTRRIDFVHEAKVQLRPTWSY